MDLLPEQFKPKKIENESWKAASAPLQALIGPVQQRLQ